MTTSSHTTDIPDMTGRSVMSPAPTAASAAPPPVRLAGAGARVVLAVRDSTKGQDAAAAMPGATEVRRLDLASLPSIREFAAGWEGDLDLLITTPGSWRRH